MFGQTKAPKQLSDFMDRASSKQSKSSSYPFARSSQIPAPAFSQSLNNNNFGYFAKPIMSTQTDYPPITHQDHASINSQFIIPQQSQNYQPYPTPGYPNTRPQAGY